MRSWCKFCGFQAVISKQRFIASVGKYIVSCSFGLTLLISSATGETPGTCDHRGYLGWINDLGSKPRTFEAWPSITIDSQLIADYDQTFAFMHDHHMNEITIWGFFTNSAWDTSITGTITAGRADTVRLLIKKAHAQGVKVLSGMGVYSWGFDKIIAAHSELTDASNRQVMCLSNPAAWNWQKKVIDFIFTFSLDGVSMQSADKGRCACARCSKYSDLEYHSILNDSCAAYIKRTYHEKIVGINTWGMSLTNKNDLPFIKTMTRHADFLTDVSEGVLDNGRAYRKEFIQAIAPCAYGTIGNPGIEPPMHWERNRWFIPRLYHPIDRLKELIADGGRAVENYMCFLNNPGDEAAIHVKAAIEFNPAASKDSLVRFEIQEIYKPNDNAALDSLVALFLGAENAFYDNCGTFPMYVQIEPLISSSPGPAVYLEYLSVPGRMKYYNELCRLRSLAVKLQNKVNASLKMKLIVSCIDNTMKDMSEKFGFAPCLP